MSPLSRHERYEQLLAERAWGGLSPEPELPLKRYALLFEGSRDEGEWILLYDTPNDALESAEEQESRAFELIDLDDGCHHDVELHYRLGHAFATNAGQG